MDLLERASDIISRFRRESTNVPITPDEFHFARTRDEIDYLMGVTQHFILDKLVEEAIHLNGGFFSSDTYTRNIRKKIIDVGNGVELSKEILLTHALLDMRKPAGEGRITFQMEYVPDEVDDNSGEPQPVSRAELIELDTAGGVVSHLGMTINVGAIPFYLNNDKILLGTEVFLHYVDILAEAGKHIYRADVLGVKEPPIISRQQYYDMIDFIVD